MYNIIFSFLLLFALTGSFIIYNLLQFSNSNIAKVIIGIGGVILIFIMFSGLEMYIVENKLFKNEELNLTIYTSLIIFHFLTWRYQARKYNKI